MKISPFMAAAAAALVTAPVAALGAGALGQVVDQGVAWIAASVSTFVVAALAGVITKVTGAVLDAKARGALEAALTKAAALGMEWVLNEASKTPLGQRLDEAVRGLMVPYTVVGAPGAIGRFKLDASGHLSDMARAELIRQLGHVAPDKLTAALSASGVTRAVPVHDMHR